MGPECWTQAARGSAAPGPAGTPGSARSHICEGRRATGMQRAEPGDANQLPTVHRLAHSKFCPKVGGRDLEILKEARFSIYKVDTPWAPRTELPELHSGVLS